MSAPKEKVIDDSSSFHKEPPAYTQSEDEGYLSAEEEAMSSSTESVAQLLQDYESVSPKSNNAEVRKDQVGEYYVSKCAGVTPTLSAKEAEGQNAALNEENTIQA